MKVGRAIEYKGYCAESSDKEISNLSKEKRFDNEIYCIVNFSIPWAHVVPGFWVGDERRTTSLSPNDPLRLYPHDH